MPYLEAGAFALLIAAIVTGLRQLIAERRDRADNRRRLDAMMDYCMIRMARDKRIIGDDQERLLDVYLSVICQCYKFEIDRLIGICSNVSIRIASAAYRDGMGVLETISTSGWEGKGVARSEKRLLSDADALVESLDDKEADKPLVERAGFIGAAPMLPARTVGFASVSKMGAATRVILVVQSDRPIKSSRKKRLLVGYLDDIAKELRPVVEKVKVSSTTGATQMMGPVLQESRSHSLRKPIRNSTTTGPKH